MLQLPRWRMTARTRLTLWYSALLVGTLLVSGVIALIVVERVLLANLDDSLRTRAVALQEGAEHEFDEGERHGTEELAVLTSGLDLVRLWDQRGRLVFGREESLVLRSTVPAPSPLPTADVFSTERLASGVVVRTVTHPFRSRGRTVGLVQIGRSTADITNVLASLRLFGLAGVLVAVALAGAGGAFLARRALAPIDRITRAAEQIGAEDLSRRLALDLPDDEIGRLAGAFDAMISRLDQAFERQRRFTADASHELRTPLALVRSQVDVALAQPRTADQYARVLAEVRDATDRLARLTDHLLTLARADANEALTRVPVDLQDLVAETAASVAAHAREQGIHLEVQLADVSAVVGDPIWLTQLLRNLLDNALRHTPAGGRVRVALEPGRGGIVLSVSDTGAGISPEHLPHLFERFYRVDAARSRAAGGAGLGLAICDWIARAHGGQITAESTIGQGATMTVWLPASRLETDASDTSQDAGGAVTAAPG